MTTITNDPEAILRTTGLDVWRYSLPPKLGVDQVRTVLPIMVTHDGRRPVVLTKEIDRTNLQAAVDGNAELVFHTPYFTFDAIIGLPDLHPDMASAVAAVASGDVTLDRQMSVSLYGKLHDALGLPDHDVDRGDAQALGGLNHYVVPRSFTPKDAVERRALAIRSAMGYVEQLGCRAALASWLEAPPSDRLATLDELLSADGIDAVLACTPLNIQELTGMPALLFAPGDVAVYARDGRDVHVLTRRELPWLGLPEPTMATSASVRALADGGRIGFEELNLSQAAFDGFGLGEASAVPASTVLRRWRERRAWEQLPYYVIGTQVTLAGITAALNLVSDALAIGRPVTELDAYDRYRRVVQSEIEQRQLPIRIRTYFTHTHAGDRSGIPASATEHRLSPDSSLKIDAGLEIYDESGAHRAISDVTRSTTGSVEAAEVYELLDRALLEAAIPACRPGRTGADVFEAGTAFLEPHHEKLAVAGFCPPAVDVTLHEMIGRDMGHLLSTQEPATTVFEKGNEATLEAGMVAAAEIQWPYRSWCLGTEDIVLVTEGDPINLTRGQPPA